MAAKTFLGRLKEGYQRLLSPFNSFINPLPLYLHRPAALLKLLSSSFYSLSSNPRAMKPVRVQIESTSVCNLRCGLCIKAGYQTRKDDHLSLDNFKRIVEDVMPLFVDLTGYGEPLMNPALFDMISFATSRGLSVKLNTNGTFLDDTTVAALSRSGIDCIAVSLDGATAVTYEKCRRGASFEKVTAGIEKLLATERGADRSMRVVVAMTIHAENIHEAPAMIDVCARRFSGAELVFQLMNGYDGGAKDPMMLENDAARAIGFLREAHALAKKHRFTATLKNIESHIAYLEELPDLKRSPCFIPWVTAYVNWSGELLPCCYFYDSQVDCGNVWKDGFSSLWNAEKMRAFRKNLSEGREFNPVCARCRMDFRGVAGVAISLSRLFFASRR